jgi:hypothetical protein
VQLVQELSELNELDNEAQKGIEAGLENNEW